VKARPIPSELGVSKWALVGGEEWQRPLPEQVAGTSRNLELQARTRQWLWVVGTGQSLLVHMCWQFLECAFSVAPPRHVTRPGTSFPLVCQHLCTPSPTISSLDHLSTWRFRFLDLRNKQSVQAVVRTRVLRDLTTYILLARHRAWRFPQQSLPPARAALCNTDTLRNSSTRIADHGAAPGGIGYLAAYAGDHCPYSASPCRPSDTRLTGGCQDDAEVDDDFSDYSSLSVARSATALDRLICNRDHANLGEQGRAEFNSFPQLNGPELPVNPSPEPPSLRSLLMIKSSYEVSRADMG
jgi:hypothetical protein